MRKKAVRAAALCMAGIMAFGAVGCSKKEGKDSAGKNSDSADELTLSHYYLEEERESSAVVGSYLHMVDEWEKVNPDVKLTKQVMAQSDYSTKIQAQAAVNEVPDIFLLKGSWVDNFVENGIVAPMNDYLDQYEYKDKFREGVFDAATRDGQIYGIPNQMTVSSVVYYNEELWKSIGYDTFPDNWKDIEEAAKKFEEKGISTISLGNSEKWPAESCILSALGDRYTGTDWTNGIIEKDGKAKFTDEGFIKALGQLQELAANGVLNPDFNTITETQGVEYYTQGKSASVVSGHWAVATIEGFAEPEVLKNTKTAVLPAADGGTVDKTSGGCGWYLAVNKNLTGEKLDKAMDFVLSTSGYELCEYAEKTYGLMGAADAGDVDTSKLPALTQNYLELVNGLELTPVYDLVMDGAVIEVMNTGIQDLLNGSKEPGDLAAEIQAEQDKL